MGTGSEYASKLATELVRYGELTLERLRSDECIALIQKHIELLPSVSEGATDGQRLLLLFSFFISALQSYSMIIRERPLLVQKVIKALQSLKDRYSIPQYRVRDEEANAKFIRILKENLTLENLNQYWNSTLILDFPGS